MSIKSLSIRIDEEMLNKLHVVADPEDVKKLQSIIKEKLKAFDETGEII